MAQRRKLRKVLLKGMKYLALTVITVLALMTIGVLISNYRPPMPPIQYQASTPDYWPTIEWKTSTPAEQGMDAGKLVEMINYYKETNAEDEDIQIESITIARNGYLVADIYLNPLFPKDTKHIIHSCTKSIMSALIGIAIDQGYIVDVDTPILGILGENISSNNDERIKELTVRDLLTMQTGLHSQDSYLYQWRGLFEMQQTDDWTQYILNLPFETEPGHHFDYSNMASFLLSAVLTKATGMNALAFARENLFDPLGIEDVKWERSPKGIYVGWARMWLKPQDMAKIGLLYLQKGHWENIQVIPTSWIEESLTAHSSPKKYRYVFNEENKIDYMTSGGSWVMSNLVRPFADGYGYQWWLDKSEVFSAIGVGGQFIMVAPKENLVVVFTSKLAGAASFLPAKMLKDFILPAVKSDEAISANEAVQLLLDSLSEPPRLALERKPIPKLPGLAFQITERPYTLDANPWQYDDLQLRFFPNKDYAAISYTTGKMDTIDYQIGLDNIHRFSETNQNTFAAKGSWVSANTFVINYEIIGYSNKGKWILTFEADDVLIEEFGVTGQYSYRGKGP